MIILLWILNFGISWLNAWGCGKSWNETKANGGIPHFMNWMGAIMSASGFTWCYMIFLALAGSVLTTKGPDGNPVPMLSPHELEAYCRLGYLVIILPILGSGLALTIHSWASFWREKNLGTFAEAAYNTFAEVYNLHSAIEHVPGAARGVIDFLFDDENDEKGKTVVILLVAFALAGGILTTWGIVRSVAKSTAYNRSVYYSNRA